MGRYLQPAQNYINKSEGKAITFNYIPRIDMTAYDKYNADDKYPDCETFNGNILSVFNTCWKV